MGARQKEWARKARAILVEQLGGCCEACGAKEELELDCIKACGDRHHRMDTSARVSFYRAQARAGNLQVLCKYHNAVKSTMEHPRVTIGGLRQPVLPFELSGAGVRERMAA